MGESKISEKLNFELNNIFIDKNPSDSGDKMNESISSSPSLLDESLLKPHHYDAQVKEENLFFTQDRSLSPIFSQSKSLKQEFENFDEKFLNEEISQESDEETIATFITAAGQQLALYAVEDSEEIFAVAVYDESGLPPTDFQFLMKSDVEKLIGEGAIRTVKKPSQLKNQVYAFDHNFTGSEEMPSSPPPLIETSEKSENLLRIKQEKFDDLLIEKNQEIIKDSPKKMILSESPEIPSQLIYENWSDNVILLIQNDNSEIEDKNEELPEIDEIDELMEKSTVQYILSDDPPDSSDLTLDDIEQVLNRNRHHQDEEEPETQIEQVNVKMENLLDKNYSDDQDDKNDAKENSSESVDFMRIKRPRKQQLTIVNRTDSEIIIQQATITSIDENSETSDYDKRKKRGKRKKKKEVRVKNGPYMRTRRRSVSKPKKAKKYRRIEVIDLDMDDVSREIINLDENKEKGSSDKENEIIMVGDSDDDDEDKEEEVEIDDSSDSDYEEVKRPRRSSRRKSEIFDCRKCRKKFRKKELFINHERVCKKEEETIRRGPMRSVRLCKEAETRGKKDYECKICHERFEVVVALARHVRLMHSLRKRDEGKRVKMREEERAGVKKKRAVDRRKREETLGVKRNVGKNPSTRKINCRECGRWFQGLGLLLAHSLQHATKKIVSEKSRVRRCQLCKKIFKSRFLFICHMRMHSNIVPLRRNRTRTIEKNEKIKKKIKKRGKPQKL